MFQERYAASRRQTMLCLSTGQSLLSRAHVAMYATRLYSATGGGGGGGGGIKPGRRVGLAVLEAPPSQLPHHPHPVPPPPASYQLYHGRHDPHRGAHFHHYHPPPHHLAPPPLPSHYHTPIPTYGGGGAPAGSGVRKKTWNFIHEKMSYDTFFTMKRLIERSRRPDEVLRWVTQNPAKISHNHYPVALQKIGQLLQATPLRSSREAVDTNASAGTARGDRWQVLEHPDFQTLCDAIINDCAKFDNFSIVNCLYAVAALGESPHRFQVLSEF